MKHRRLLALIVLAGIATALGVVPRVVGDEEAAQPQSWLRIDEDEHRVVHLDVAMRTYAPKDGGGPTITLAGAVHIGERRFYKHLQDELERFDLVLYEGVNPPGSGELPEDLTARERVERTKSRMRLVAILVERHRAGQEAYPASLDELAAALEEHRRQAHWLEDARTDAWSNPIRLSLSDDGTFDLVSLGADGAPGGEGADADLRFSDQDPLSEAELGMAPGLQRRLAETFRLRFQLDEMDETRPHWRNADMDVDELQERLGAGEEEGEGAILFDLLDGSSAMARMASFALSMIERLPGAAPRGRLMIMEMLSLADESMLAAATPGGEELIDVLIDERNQVVVDELREVLRHEPEHQRIAVIYGAGHMPDLEQRIVDQLGYRPTGEPVWNTAMRLPLERFGITAQERILLRATLIRQLSELESVQRK